MLSNINFMDYFREVANSAKFQISAAVSFGTALVLIWSGEDDHIKTIVTILFLFAACMFVISLTEKVFYGIYKKIKKKRDWNNLTPEEITFVSYYIENNTKTRYVVINNGTYRDSGIINPLIDKRILYRASNMSEYRGDSVYTMEQTFPFNIYDEVFSFFIKKLQVKKI